MPDLHELTRIIALAAIGITVCVCLYKLGAFAIRALSRVCPDAPTAAALPVDIETEQHGAENVLLFGGKLRKAREA